MKAIVIFFSAGLISFASTAEVLVLEGKFQNKNIFVQNSFGSNGVGFCTTEIKVNGKITADEINSSAFEIDLAAMNIKPGSKVLIEISHKSDCMPIVLNPEVLKSRSTYEILNMSITSTGVLKWTTEKESDPLPYIVEQFKWNKWVVVGKVQGIGGADKHDYAIEVTTHSGENKFRIKQVGSGAGPKISNPVILTSILEKPSYAISKDNKTIQFSSETAFEVYDPFGTIVKKGFDKHIPIENLPKGIYCLCYDNQVTEFERKK